MLYNKYGPGTVTEWCLDGAAIGICRSAKLKHVVVLWFDPHFLNPPCFVSYPMNILG